MTYTKFKAYILSVPDTDRRTNVENLKVLLENAGIPTKILDGFYYKQRDVVSDLYSKGLIYDCPDKTLSLSQIGCFLSHRQAWEHIMMEDDPEVFSIIIEDDMTLLDPSGFSIDYLLHDINQQTVFHGLVLWKHPAQLQENPKYQTANLLHFYYQWGLCVYGVTRELAGELVGSIKKLDIPVDQILFGRIFPNISSGIFMVKQEHFLNLGILSSYETEEKPFKSLIWE